MTDTAMKIDHIKTGNPFVEDLLAESLAVTDRLLSLTDAPGLGIELDRDVVECYRAANSFAIPAGVYSDFRFGGR